MTGETKKTHGKEPPPPPNNTMASTFAVGAWANQITRPTVPPSGMASTPGMSVFVGTLVITEPPLAMECPESPVDQETEDDNEVEERGLTTLNQMHEELLQKKWHIEALERQARIQVIRQ